MVTRQDATALSVRLEAMRDTFRIVKQGIGAAIEMFIRDVRERAGLNAPNDSIVYLRTDALSDDYDGGFWLAGHDRPIARKVHFDVSPMWINARGAHRQWHVTDLPGLRWRYFYPFVVPGRDGTKQLAVLAIRHDATSTDDFLDMLTASNLGCAFEELLANIRETALLHRRTMTCQLTNAFNKRAYGESLERVAFDLRTTETVQPVWLGRLDINKFKEINDRFGHTHADTVLKMLIHIILERQGRLHDSREDIVDYLQHWIDMLYISTGVVVIPFRVSGDEFAFLMTGNQMEIEQWWVETFALLENANYGQYTGVMQPTCSLGVIPFDLHLSVEEIDAVADSVCYFAKQFGPQPLPEFSWWRESRLKRYQRRLARQSAKVQRRPTSIRFLVPQGDQRLIPQSTHWAFFQEYCF